VETGRLTCGSYTSEPNDFKILKFVQNWFDKKGTTFKILEFENFG
jgi:hypothetical protein